MQMYGAKLRAFYHYLPSDKRVEEAKCKPWCLRKLYLATRSEIERNVRLPAEQAYEQILDAEQLAAGWTENESNSIQKDVCDRYFLAEGCKGGEEMKKRILSALMGLCLLLTAVSRTTLPTLTLPLLVPDLFFAALLAAAFVGYRREGAWMQDDHLTLRRQKGFHLHCVCALHPDLCLTVQQSPWAVAAHRANLTLIFPGRLKQKVRSVALTELAFLQQAER